ncbi:peptide-N(4)-(N-acetyl-beta-glucosaminyl)asparagine amidase-like isoform X2 [Dendronephthya gigantea]|uniref:peptide-N(4)-(N-acetyl-beta- glucosaminyl)asparagine amidase-like isoform X2 n=1 Tax=Dendronephthya gigantea TaxID=151771 RepID=UPI0010692CF4|nr:peptide-N(4)-(N-acetyl-beta-glucosaminyl)asparagine amidase-like isoform X2 [Dendronephthya gigantea]
MSLKCDDCQMQGTAIGGGVATAEEQRWGAGRVELYQCPKCKKIMRFPRYNHPQKLLETRIGRCGEWANAFTMCCIALGFKTRYVLDWTDHVWTEVFSDAQQKWLHCDPCEGICDRPLLYEAGWNKKLTYIIAFAKNQIMDVTWRYSNKHEEVRKRRNECRETWLVLTISTFNKNFLDPLPKEQKQKAEIQNMKELVSFLSVKKEISDEERQGRTSGSVEWRRARGELGESSKEAITGFVFKPNEKDVQAGSMRVRYSTATDMYYRGLEDDVIPGNDDVKGWQNGVNSMTSVFRKEEHDWKMSYLARKEGTESGKITWIFDVSECGCEIDEVSVRALFTTFEDGEAKMELKEDKDGGIIKILDGISDTTFKPSGHPVIIKLTASLGCKKNDKDNCWQHSQIFRQPLDNQNYYPLDITVKLKPKK